MENRIPCVWMTKVRPLLPVCWSWTLSQCLSICFHISVPSGYIRCICECKNSSSLSVPSRLIVLNITVLGFKIIRFNWTNQLVPLSKHSVSIIKTDQLMANGEVSYCLYSVLNRKSAGTLLVAQLVEALRYKPVGRGFDSRWCHWNSSLT
jgi:hypothetical protein